MGFPLVPLLLGVELRLEGMSDRLCRPLHKCLTEELRTLQAPMHPRLLPAAFGDRGNPGILLQFSSGGIAFPLFAKGDEETGSKDWPSTWEGLEEGEVGRLGARCAMAVSKSAMACKVTRSWATSAWTNRALGVMTPSSVVNGVAR